MLAAVYKATAGQPRLVQAPASMLRVTGERGPRRSRLKGNRPYRYYLAPIAKPGRIRPQVGELLPWSPSASHGPTCCTQHFYVQVGATVGREVFTKQWMAAIANHRYLWIYRPLRCFVSHISELRLPIVRSAIATSYVRYSGLDTVDNVMIDINTPQSRPWLVESIRAHQDQPTKGVENDLTAAASTGSINQAIEQTSDCPEPRDSETVQNIQGT